MLRDHTYDLLMLDVRMPHLDGLELARLLLRFSDPPSVVFVTAYDGHAVEAFEVRASDYLLKPPSADRLARRSSGCAGPVEARTPRTTSHVAGRHRGHDPDGRPIRHRLGRGPGRLRPAARVGGANHLIRLPISILAERWADAGFVRIHRGYLVAIRHITELSSEGGASTVRVGGTELPVSRRHTRELRERLVRAARRGGLR